MALTTMELGIKELTKDFVIAIAQDIVEKKIGDMQYNMKGQGNLGLIF